MPDSLILLVGPAGVGKNTLIQRAVAADPCLAFLPSLTTRPMRLGESEGSPYHFVSVEYFAERIENNEMLEWQRVNGHYYGTSVRSVKQARLGGMMPITDVDILGAHSLLLRSDLDVCTVFINSPSKEETHRRIEAREKAISPQLAARLKRSALEERAVSLCDYLLINDALDTTTQSLLGIVEAFRARGRLASVLETQHFVRRRTLIQYRVRLMRDTGSLSEQSAPGFLTPITVEGSLESLRAVLARFFVLLQLKTDLEISGDDFEIAEGSTLEVTTADSGHRLILPFVTTRSEEAFQKLELAIRRWEANTSPLTLQEASL